MHAETYMKILQAIFDVVKFTNTTWGRIIGSTAKQFSRVEVTLKSKQTRVPFIPAAACIRGPVLGK